mgnify:CR=1 FL=1
MKFATASWVAAVMAVIGMPAGWAAEPAPGPNILWLIGEDLGTELGCYGTAEVATPNLDRLASQGMRFTRAYTTGPVCSPSRSAFMTGMYQITIGAHNHRSHRDDGYRLPEGVRVLTDWLRPAGYFTANVVQFPQEMGLRGTGKTDWNFTYEGAPFDSNRWEDLARHQPFYAQVNFTETHRPFRAPQRVDAARVRIPPYYPDHPITRQDWAAYLDAVAELDRKVGLVLDRLEADGLADRTVVVFFGDNGQAHVRGKQWCYESGLHVPLIIRWPKGIPAPAGYRPGQVSDQLIDMIDLAATTLAWAGVAKPAKMEGRVFLAHQADPPREFSFGARDRCDETVFRIRTVRDARYRYIRNFTPDRPFLSPNAYKERSYPVWNLIKELAAAGKLDPVQAALAAPTMPAEELYDLQADPYETRNLVGSPVAEHQEALRRLRAALEKWLDETHDAGAQFEPPEVAAAHGWTKPKPAPQKPKGKGKKAKSKA